jgi:hypothetical protein
MLTLSAPGSDHLASVEVRIALLLHVAVTGRSRSRLGLPGGAYDCLSWRLSI